MKSKLIMNLDDEHYKMLENLKRKTALSRTAIVRLAIRLQYNAIIKDGDKIATG